MADQLHFDFDPDPSQDADDLDERTRGRRVRDLEVGRQGCAHASIQLPDLLLHNRIAATTSVMSGADGTMFITVRRSRGSGLHGVALPCAGPQRRGTTAAEPPCVGIP